MQGRKEDVQPLQTASTTESEIEEDPLAQRRHRWGGLALVGLLMVGAFAASTYGSSRSSSSIAESGSHFDDVLELASLSPKSTKKDTTKDEAQSCSWGKQNCNASKCCNNPGMQCYEQTQWYAQCRETCTKGPDPSHWDAEHWSCKELGERKEGSAKCSDLGEDCHETQCCNTIGTQCYKKDDGWATCKSECNAGFPDLSDADNKPWLCEPLGDLKKGASDWVDQLCSADGDDCSKTQCCQQPGKQCFAQSEYFAQCMHSCPEDDWQQDWTCDAIGARTPDQGGAAPGKLGEWVLDTCVDQNTDCRDARCCLNMGMQCYEKDKDWAACLDECTEGYHLDDNNESWTCKQLGPEQKQGLAVKGSPSLFCWSLFQTTTYEMRIMQNQLEQNAGIFQCDDYALLSTDDETEMGVTKDHFKRKIKTLKVKKAEITQSVDGTAGNAKLFINCWDVILKDGRWNQHAWIIKVDPDAVIIPYRVRDHLKQFVMENVYVVNCNAFPSSPNFPMMYGSVEIYSFKAIQTYSWKHDMCIADMGSMLPKWGEDYYMTHCLDHIGVGRISDFVSVGDNVCSGGSCADGAFSAFHPYKSVDDWQNCWDYAHGKAEAPPPAPANQWMK